DWFLSLIFSPQNRYPSADHGSCLLPPDISLEASRLVLRRWWLSPMRSPRTTRLYAGECFLPGSRPTGQWIYSAESLLPYVPYAQAAKPQPPAPPELPWSGILGPWSDRALRARHVRAIPEVRQRSYF